MDRQPSDKTRIPYSHKRRLHDRELFDTENLIIPDISIPHFECLDGDYSVQSVGHHHTFFSPKSEAPGQSPSLVIKTNKGNFYLECFGDFAEHNIFHMLLTVVLQLPVLEFRLLHCKSHRFRSLLFGIEKYFFKKQLFSGEDPKTAEVLKALKTRFWIVYKYKRVVRAKSAIEDCKVLRKYFNSYSSETKLTMLQLGSKLLLDFLFTKSAQFTDKWLHNLIFSEERGKDAFFTFRNCLQQARSQQPDQTAHLRSQTGHFCHLLRLVCRALQQVKTGRIDAHRPKSDFGGLQFLNDIISR